MSTPKPPPLPEGYRLPAEITQFTAADVPSLAALLDVEAEFLADVATNAEESYHRFPLSKGNGRKRWIEAPSKKLKFIQKRILELKFLNHQKKPSKIKYII